MAREYDYIVLGAGVSGLSFAREVAQKNKSVLILERDAIIGGLARTFEYEGHRFDYCAHRFHSANQEVLENVKSLVGPSFKKHRQMSRVFMFGKYLKYPFELQNFLRALPVTVALTTGLSFLSNYVYHRMRKLLGIKEKQLTTYEEWFVRFFGFRLYRLMSYRYTRKIWKTEPKHLSADWADERFQGVRLRRVLKVVIKKIIRLDFSTFNLRDENLIPDGGEFYYGENGAQDIPDAYEREIAKLGGEILTRVRITEVDVKNKQIQFLNEGKEEVVRARSKLVSTIPLHALEELSVEKHPEVQRDLSELKYMDIIFVYLLLNQDSVSKDHWLYFPDEEIIFNRSVEFRNWSQVMSPPGKTALCLDITCYEGDDIWNKTDQELVDACIEGVVEKAKLIDAKEIYDSLVIRVKDAYPFYGLGYRDHLHRIVHAIEESGNIVCLGRTGIFKYNNSDGAIEMGVALAETLLSDEPDQLDRSNYTLVDFKQKEISL